MSKSEIVIGINPCTYGLNYHDPSIAIIKDGNIIFSIEEERINGIKGSKGIFPAESIKYGMEYCKLTWDDIDGIAIGYDPLLWQDRLQLEMNAILDRRKNSEPDKNDCRHSAREIRSFLYQITIICCPNFVYSWYYLRFNQSICIFSYDYLLLLSLISLNGDYNFFAFDFFPKCGHGISQSIQCISRS